MSHSVLGDEGMAFCGEENIKVDLECWAPSGLTSFIEMDKTVPISGPQLRILKRRSARFHPSLNGCSTELTLFKLSQGVQFFPAPSHRLIPGIGDVLCSIRWKLLWFQE